MKSIILKGEKITIGSQVRFIDNSKLYVGMEDISKPTLGEIYTVRGFTTKNGFYLEEIKNPIIKWYFDDGTFDSEDEPGFATWRFEPILRLKNSLKKKNKIVNIEILPIVEERIDLQALKIK